MSVHNIDIDMQHPEFQPEDVQTSHDADLFGDDEDDDKGAGDFVDALSQPPTSVPRLNKRARDEVILRQTVYEQQERINNIIQETEVICQEAQDHIEELQCIAEEEHERHMRDFNEQWEAALREREREKQEIHTWQEQQQALLRKNIAEELARHEAKISARKDQEKKSRGGEERPNTGIANDVKQLEERERAIFAEMERRLQLEIEKMKVEKENKLANMEQRFARHGRQQHAATEIGTDPTRRNAQQPPQTPQKPQFKTPCLETIKKIRKACGTTRKMRLVSVVEGEIQRLLKDTFSISQDADFIVHQPADREDVYSYKYEDGPGPNTQNLAFDLKHGFNTPWNAKILDILLEELKKRSVEEEWPFRRSDGYYKAILKDRYKQLQMVWRAAQPKVTAKGSLETAAEVEERLIAKRGENLKLVSSNNLLAKSKVLEQVIELKKDG
ncbi:uncharacterized protein EDB91DRAFT_1086736 [Suillus paluster]|uniref:uncharacterized protein n=1 Tax=Suillus paluster TaxID=48578 RepID=UPI001B86E167|nr:uncharacterized protein EDB91DRAFT_1086736 [Suillus paluster]KAG1726499.1 hypothetical protein EDB91DRAFT_1086736 [Suillus paluster]